MIDRELFDELSPRALEWAKTQEEFIRANGSPLSAAATIDATRAGVQHPECIRVLVVDRIPLPDDPQLAEASRRAQIITDASRAVAMGYGIVVRADCWGDRELLIHQFVHVAQCERHGGVEAFAQHYLSDRTESPQFTLGELEEEARRIARQLNRR